MTSNPNLPPSTKILVVDDMPSVREELIKVLRQMGFSNITEAEDGKGAWIKLSTEAQVNEPFQFIFSDINMPNCNGIELLKLIRSSETYFKTPVIMVSTENETTVILECIEEGANNYILKPFNLDTIKDKIYSSVLKK